MNKDNAIIKTKKYIRKYLVPIIQKTNEKLEGNLFFNHHQKDLTKYRLEGLVKAENIFELVINKNLKNIMEIGFNSGFSSLLMLVSNPSIKVTCYDIASHTYTLPCFEQIKKTFGDRIDLIIGDSTKTLLSTSDVYDLIHIDGSHDPDVAAQDVENCYRCSKVNTIFIFDDYNFLNKLWDFYVDKFSLVNFESPSIQKTKYHDIKIRIKP